MLTTLMILSLDQGKHVDPRGIDPADLEEARRRSGAEEPVGDPVKGPSQLARSRRFLQSRLADGAKRAASLVLLRLPRLFGRKTTQN